MSFSSRALALVVSVSLVAAMSSHVARAQPARALEIRYTPTARAQIAIWVESADGTYMGTIKLTEAVAYRGIGNRPGALQMNSGFRWPYGRREGVLPVWAHRRVSAPGAESFRRVIFQNRGEGLASRLVNDYSRDNYFCLSFNQAAAQDLDAVSCASVFNSDKGRFITSTDVQNGYSEPWQTSPGVEGSRVLTFDALYPPRRDILMRTGFDHVDVDSFRSEALRVMPELDAITMATAPASQPQLIQFDVPDAWPNGDYILYVEANTERGARPRIRRPSPRCTTTGPRPTASRTAGSRRSCTACRSRSPRTAARTRPPHPRDTRTCRGSTARCVRSTRLSPTRPRPRRAAARTGSAPWGARRASS